MNCYRKKVGGKGSSGKAKPKFKSYAEARKDREKFRKKLVNCHCDAYVDAVDVSAVDKFKRSAFIRNDRGKRTHLARKDKERKTSFMPNTIYKSSIHGS